MGTGLFGENMDIGTFTVILNFTVACFVTIFVMMADKKLNGNWNNWDEKLGIGKMAVKLGLAKQDSYNPC